MHYVSAFNGTLFVLQCVLYFTLAYRQSTLTIAQCHTYCVACIKQKEKLQKE